MTPWPDKLLKKWDALNADEKKLFIRQVEVYAAYLAYTDHEIGRVIQAVEDMGKLDNTLIIYISGDNGSSAEGTLIGTPNEVAMFNGVDVPVEDQLKYFYDVWGTDRTYSHMAVPWTWAFDTPFSWTKQIASHFGGTRQGMCISWPGHIKDAGGIRNQFHHVIDIVPTILEACRHPRARSGRRHQAEAHRRREHGLHLRQGQRRRALAHKTQYFEMMGDHAIYHDGWIASTKVIRPPWVVAGPVNQDPFNNCTWELYDLTKDWTQTDDVAAKYPDKVKEMKKLFAEEARKYKVLPLDASVATRLVAPRPNITAGRTEFTYTKPLTGIPQGDSPLLLNCSYTITADIEVPEGGAEGMLLTSGGRFAGYGFYLFKGKPVFLWNLVDLKRVRWEGPEALDARQAHRRVRFQIRRPRRRHARLQQHERHRPRRHRRAQGGRQGGRHPEDGAHPPVDPAMGRDFRHRLRHRHARVRPRLPGVRSLSRANSTSSRSRSTGRSCRRPTSNCSNKKASETIRLASNAIQDCGQPSHAAALYTMHLSSLWERYHPFLASPTVFAVKIGDKLNRITGAMAESRAVGCLELPARFTTRTGPSSSNIKREGHGFATRSHAPFPWRIF